MDAAAAEEDEATVAEEEEAAACRRSHPAHAGATCNATPGSGFGVDATGAGELPRVRKKRLMSIRAGGNRKPLWLHRPAAA